MRSFASAQDDKKGEETTMRNLFAGVAAFLGMAGDRFDGRGADPEA